MKTRFGVIGLGNRGRKFALNTLISHPDIDIVSVCDQNRKHFKVFNELKISTTVDYKILMENPEVDAVFIATPDDTHADIILEAIKHQKHILCEKPLEVSKQKIFEINAALEGYKKVFQVGYVLRYAPLYEKAKKLMASGLIGDVILGNGTDHINYGGYAFFHDWHRTKSRSYSLLLQKATHSLDILSWMIDSEPIQVTGFGGLAVFGEPGAEKKFGEPLKEELHCNSCRFKVSCEESLLNVKIHKGIEWAEDWPDKCVFDSEIDVQDHQVLLIQYKNRAKVTYTLCQFAAYYRREFQFFGTEGELYFNDERNEIIVNNRLKQERMVYEVKEIPGHGGGDDEMINQFLHCIFTGEEPRSNLTSSLSVSNLVLAAQEAIDTNKIITLGGPV